MPEAYKKRQEKEERLNEWLDKLKRKVGRFHDLGKGNPEWILK